MLFVPHWFIAYSIFKTQNLKVWKRKKESCQTECSRVEMPFGKGCTELVTLHKKHLRSSKVRSSSLDSGVENLTVFCLSLSLCLSVSPSWAEQSTFWRHNSEQKHNTQRWVSVLKMNAFFCVCVWVCRGVFVSVLLCSTATAGNLWWYSKAIVD